MESDHVVTTLTGAVGNGVQQGNEKQTPATGYGIGPCSSETAKQENDSTQARCVNCTTLLLQHYLVDRSYDNDDPA